MTSLSDLPWIKAYAGMEQISTMQVKPTDTGNIPAILQVSKRITQDSRTPIKTSGYVDVTVTPQPTYGMEWTDWASLVFPPALLWKATDPTPVGGAPMPTTTVSGDPNAVSEFLSSSPIITTTEKDDPFAGLTDISNMVMKIAPVLLLFALIGGLKKVF
jgi:hypothetical protein